MTEHGGTGLREQARRAACAAITGAGLLAAGGPAFATTFTVSNTLDSGAGSLRQAITDANADASATSASPHVIQFAIPGGGVQTIAPATVYPAISRPVIIDGYTQSGSSVNTLAVGDNAVIRIELDGTGIAAGNGCLWLQPGSGGSIVRGLAVNRCGSIGLNLSTGNVQVTGNFLGVDAAGNVNLGGGNISGISGFSADVGPVIVGGTTAAARNVINGLVIWNGGNPLFVQGNYIGTNAAGTARLAGGGVIIDTLGGGSLAIGAYTIGGATATPGTPPGNVIVPNGSNGTIAINSNSGPTLGPGIVQGNLLGLDATGATVLAAPGSNGVVILDDTYQTGGGPAIAPVLVGGPSATERNVIAGMLSGVASNANALTVQNNYIGTDATGTLARNNNFGVRVAGSTAFPAHATIGGGGAGNVIAASNVAGVYALAASVTVQQNKIGVGADGATALGNAEGVHFESGDGVVGGGSAGLGNVIANSFSTDGVRVVVNPAFGPTASASILGNSIFQNNGLGINLGSDLVTANDAGDVDTGPNGLQNFPNLTSATAAGLVQGTLNSTANATFRIEYFANAGCDGSGAGEGQTFLGSQNVNTDGAGNATLSFAGPALPGGQSVVTATATDAAGNTSEFSACVTAGGVAATPALSINNVTSNEGNAGTTAFTFTVTLSAASGSTVTVDYATVDGTATAPADYAAASGTLTFAPGVTTQTITVNVVGDATVEPTETFTVGLSNPSNATVATATGTGTILNDDSGVIGGGAAAQNIPTLSDYALGLLTLTMGFAAACRLRGRRR